MQTCWRILACAARAAAGPRRSTASGGNVAMSSLCSAGARPGSTTRTNRLKRTAMPIYFYSTRDAYGCFSNFSAHGIELKGTWWRTSEHYFQAQKFAGTEHEEAIRLAKTPKQAAEMGRERSRPLRADWEQL